MQHTEIILSVSRSLWQRVFASIRSVQFSTADSVVQIVFYLETPPSKDEIDDMESAVSEVAADFPNYEITHDVQVVPISRAVPTEPDGYVVYFRKE